MKWKGNRQSSNVEDRRGMRMGGRSVGLGTVAIALVASYFFGVDPGMVINVLSGGGGAVPVTGQAPPASDEKARFVATVLADTEDVWSQIFSQGGANYVAPKLVLFSGQTPTACGTGQSASGPFYCPTDQNVYIDLRFYQLMQERFGVSGEFAQAYVIAHEVGHHVQYLLGVTQQAQDAQRRLGRAEANAVSVRVELQADCFAGVWAHHANTTRQILEDGDVEAALNAASAIGDDALQRQAQGEVVPDSFTHGSSAQRVRWFKRGIEQGRVEACDTFEAKTL